jgi:membrane protein YqaA with SNARE-associated domain
MSAPDDTLTEPAPSVALSARRLLFTTVVALLGVMAAAAAIGYWFRGPLEQVSRAFVDVFGGPGVALGFFLPDAFTLPLPADLTTLLALAGDMSFRECVAWGWTGSILGGALGYWVGRRLRGTRWVVRIFERNRVQATLDRYGLAAVAVAAITPLPYSLFCWAAGAARLPFWRFLALSAVCRLGRVAGYLYLVQLGLFGTAG